MAISLVGTASGSNISGANVTITLSGLGLAENDIVLVMGGNGGDGTTPAVTTSGYTSLANESRTDNALNASYKRMGVSPDTSVTCNGGGHANDAVCYVVMAFRGVSTTTAIDATTTTDTGNGAPNSPPITTATNNAAVVSCFTIAGQDSTITAPSGYGSAVVISRSDANAISAGAAYRLVASAGVENPGVWTDTSLSGYCAFSIALRPAASGTVSDGALAATGTITPTFIGPNEVNGQLSITATGSAAWVGQALALTGALEATGTASVTFVGTRSNDGNLSATGTWTITWVGDKEYMSSVREVIESKGAASVTVS